MKKPWKSATAIGFANLIRQAVSFNLAQIPVVSGSTVNLQQCFDCGALLTNERVSAHTQWHSNLYQNFMNVHGAVVQVSSPLLEIRDRVEEIDQALADATPAGPKKLPRPKKETGYVKPHRGSNPQSTIPMQIPADSANGDIFVYDAQKNALLRVQQAQHVPHSPWGWRNNPNTVIDTTNMPASSATDMNATVQPMFDPSRGLTKSKTCQWCGNEHYSIDGYTIAKTTFGVKEAFEVCKSCYDQHRGE